MSHLLFRDAEDDLAPNARALVRLRVAECGAAEGVGGVEVLHHERVLDLGCDVEQIDGVVVPRKLERRLAGLFGWSGRRERGFFGREARTRRGRRDEEAAKTGAHYWGGGGVGCSPRFCCGVRRPRSLFLGGAPPSLSRGKAALGGRGGRRSTRPKA